MTHHYAIFEVFLWNCSMMKPKSLTSSLNMFHLLTILSEKKCCLRSVITRFLCNFRVSSCSFIMTKFKKSAEPNSWQSMSSKSSTKIYSHDSWPQRFHIRNIIFKCLNTIVRLIIPRILVALLHADCWLTLLSDFKIITNQDTQIFLLSNFFKLLIIHIIWIFLLRFTKLHDFAFVHIKQHFPFFRPSTGSKFG